MEEKPLYGGLTVYRERGAYLRRLEQFDKAKAAYDEAYKFNANDVRMLIGRSQVCSDAVEPQEAFANAALALQLEPGNMVAKNTQARAMYTMSAFENSMIMSHQGSRVRKQPPYFKEGFIQARETIQDCIGTHAGDVMKDFLPIIRTMRQTYGVDLEPAQIQRVSRIPKVEVKEHLSKLESRKHEIISRVMAMKYLGPMAYDKFFLQALIEDPRLKSANLPGTKELENVVDSALKKLDNRQEMLRAQRPYYSIKKAEKCESSRLTKFKKDTLIEERKVGAMNVDRGIKAIFKCLQENRIKDMVFKAERLQMFLNNRTPRNLPQIDFYHDQIYMLLGKGYLSQYRVSYKLSEKSNGRRVNFLLGLPTGRLNTYDSVIANYPSNLVDVNVQIRNRMKQLEMCENAYMSCWLCFELARLELKLKNYSKATFYAQKCQKQALDLVFLPWRLNACICLMSGDIQQGNIHEFKLHIQEGLEWSKQLTTDAMTQLQYFFLKCLELADTNLVVSEHTAKLKRENDILKALDTKTKTDATIIFRHMAAVPHGRRFSVLPQTPKTLNMASERRRVRQRGLTIVPGKEKTLRLPPKSHIEGYQKFDF